MRSYSVAVASLALDAPVKWTDNAISAHRIEGVVSARRGVARHISFQALLLLAVVRELHLQLGCSVARAFEIGRDLTDGARPGELHFGDVTVSVDVAHLRRTIESRLAEALESAPTPRRGRASRDARM